MKALILLVIQYCVAFEFNEYSVDYGVYLGQLSNIADGEITGDVFAINETAIQLVEFSYNGKGADVYFWLDRTENPTKEGIKVPSQEFGVAPIKSYENTTVVLILPGLHKVTSFKSFSLYCLSHDRNFGNVEIKEGLIVPHPQFLTSELKGNRYGVGSGPILILDRRTIKIFGFTFDGDKAPDGYFFVGRGPKVVFDAGVKVPIRGRDSQNIITAMNERYRGGHDIIIDLPDEYDINHIDWLAIYCYKFQVNFGNVPITNISQRIPPYIPYTTISNDLSNVDGWQVNSLFGTSKRLNFTFQLGMPGGNRGYKYIAKTRPGNYVWYVNGYLADLYLRRNVTYTFIIQGGNDKSTNDFYNPLYISDDPFGGYLKWSNEERHQVNIFAGNNPETSTGNLCIWTEQNPEIDPDTYQTFVDYRRTLKLKCDNLTSSGILKFTPNVSTPDTLYYQSYTNYNMGYKIHIVDELPENMDDFVEEPYEYEAWLKHQNLQLNQRGVNSAPSCFSIMLISGIMFFFKLTSLV